MIVRVLAVFVFTLLCWPLLLHTSRWSPRPHAGRKTCPAFRRVLFNVAACLYCSSEPDNGRAAAITEPSAARAERMFLLLSVPSEPEHNTEAAAHPWFSQAAAGSIPTSKPCGDKRAL